MEIVQTLPRIRELLSAGNLVEAAAAFEGLLRSYDGLEREQAGFEIENLYLLYCNLCLQTDRSDMPLAWLEKALALDPEFSGRLRLFGNELLRKGKIEQADEMTQKLCRLQSVNHQNWLDRAGFLVRTQRLEEAEECFQQALSMTKGTLETYLEIARRYIEGGQPERAGTLLCGFVKQGVRKPQVVDLLIRLCEKELLAPEDAGTVKELSRARKARIHLNLAWFRYTEGDLSGAARLFQRATEIDGSNPEVFLDLKQAVVALSGEPNEDCATLCEVHDSLQKEIHDAK